jgi:hypothetical protein
MLSSILPQNYKISPTYTSFSAIYLHISKFCSNFAPEIACEPKIHALYRPSLTDQPKRKALRRHIENNEAFALLFVEKN